MTDEFNRIEDRRVIRAMVRTYPAWPQMRTTDDIDALLVTAWQRRERRLATFAALRDGFPTPAYWRALDLVHEATRLIDSLERRRVYLPTIPRYDHTWLTR